MNDTILEFTIKEEDCGKVTAVSLEDIDLFTMYIAPTEEELKIIYSYGFILIKIINEKNYSKYIFSKKKEN